MSRDSGARDDAVMMMGSDSLFVVVPLQNLFGDVRSPVTGMRASAGSKATTADILLTIGVAHAALDRLTDRLLGGILTLDSEVSAELMTTGLAQAMELASQTLTAMGDDEHVEQSIQVFKKPQ